MRTFTASYSLDDPSLIKRSVILMSNLRAIHLTHSLSRLAGGLFESVRHLSHGVQAIGGIDLEILALEDARSADDAPRWNPLPTTIHAVRGPEAFGYAPTLLPHLLSSDPDVLHVHGIWKYPSVAVNQWHKRTGQPYIVSPHGMLEPWALQNSRLKKRLAMWLYEKACLSNATCLRATSMMEVESIRSAGLRNQIALIPNGVEMPPESAVRVLPGFSSSGGESGLDGVPKTRTALFLSRIHPKKGLLNLVEAWRQVAPVGWRLSIVGPDEGGHLAEVQCAVKLAGLDGSVDFPDEAWGDDRWNFYRDADLFVLPTFSENFGLVIAEALACGVPVITTRGTPWEELLTKQCGWWIDIGVEPLVTALKDAISKLPTETNAMGLRGREWVTGQYSWEPISKMMTVTFQWLAGSGSKPAWIIAGI